MIRTHCSSRRPDTTRSIVGQTSTLILIPTVGLTASRLAAPPLDPQNGGMSSPNMPPVIDLDAAFASIEQPWTPHLAAEVNGHHVRLARFEGAFTWHSHEQEDELFLVVRGSLRIEFRDGERTLGPGSMLLVPRGVEHRPVAEPTADVLLFEPGATVSTGATDDPRRVSTPPRLDAATEEL